MPARCLVNLDNLSVKYSFSLHLMKLSFVAYSCILFTEFIEINLTMKYCLSGLKLFGYACVLDRFFCQTGEANSLKCFFVLNIFYGVL